jgi:hypothetical protein
VFVLQSLSTLQDLSHEERQIPVPLAPPGPTGPAVLLLLLLEHPPDHAIATPTANASATPLENVEKVMSSRLPSIEGNLEVTFHGSGAFSSEP